MGRWPCRSCWPDPIQTPALLVHCGKMLTERTTNEAGNELRVAADAVERIDDGGEIAGLPDHLARLGDALRAAGGAYETAASRVVPAAQPLDRGIAFRYLRAAATWPAAPPPSHERFAAALASLHAAADAARLAGRRSDEARRAVDALWQSGSGSAAP
jgi:hypothetical protein